MGLLKNLFSSENEQEKQQQENGLIEMPKTNEEKEFEELEKQLMELKAYEKSFKSRRDLLFDEVQKTMRKYNITKWNGLYLDMDLISARVGMSFDTKRFQAEHPELYAKYLTEKSFSGYLRIK